MLHTDQKHGLPNILRGFETEDLVVKHLDTEVEVLRVEAPGEWTHELLKSALAANSGVLVGDFGYDCWIGPIWAGDTAD